jgi:hypothetical protein
MWTVPVEHRVGVASNIRVGARLVHNPRLPGRRGGTLRRMTPHSEPSAQTTDAASGEPGPLPAIGRLQLVPGTRVLWRSADAVQWESGGRAFVLQGIDPASLAALVGEPANEAGPAIAAARHALHTLGLLWAPPGVVAPRRSSGAGRPPGAQQTGLRRPELPERLLSDLGALAARRGDEAAAAMTTRRSRSVRLVGTDRLATSIGSVLAAAGVGRVDIPLDGEVRLFQTMPGGLPVAAEGRRRADSAAAAIRAAAPEVDIGSGSDGRAPDLMIITGSRPADDDLRARLQGDGIPHLLVGVYSVRATIGPLVVPGRTSCLRCADLHRIDRDPAWPALAAQLATVPARSEPSDVALCTAATGIAALHALAFLDGETPASMDGTLEMTLPDWRLRRRSRPTHDACACRQESA